MDKNAYFTELSNLMAHLFKRVLNGLNLSTEFQQFNCEFDLLMKKLKLYSYFKQAAVRLILFFLGILGLSGVTILLLGFCLPNQFSGEVSKQFSCQPEQIWEILASPKEHKKINSEVASVNLIDINTWEEVDKLGGITRYEVIESIENEKLVVKVISPTLHVEKTRTYKILRSEDTSFLTVKQTCYIEQLLLKSTMAISGAKQDIKKEVNELYAHLNF